MISKTSGLFFQRCMTLLFHRAHWIQTFHMYKSTRSLKKKVFQSQIRLTESAASWKGLEATGATVPRHTFSLLPSIGSFFSPGFLQVLSLLSLIISVIYSLSCLALPLLPFSPPFPHSHLCLCKLPSSLLSF